MKWVWLVAAVTAEVAATLSLRASGGLRDRRWTAPVVAGYVLAFVFLSLALGAGMPVGVAYAVWASIGIISVALIARLIWRDPLTARMVAGIAVITVGVVLVELGSG